MITIIIIIIIRRTSSDRGNQEMPDSAADISKRVEITQNIG